MTARLGALSPDALSPRARTLYDAFAARFGAVRGPWAIALRDPDVADLTFKMYERLCPGTRLRTALFELMVLVVARHFTCQYEWFIHARLAREAGLAPDVIGAIRTRQVPALDGEERLVYDVASELVSRWSLDDATYARARDALGEELLVELVTATGFYAMLAMQLNAFAAPIPADAEQLSP